MNTHRDSERERHENRNEPKKNNAVNEKYHLHNEFNAVSKVKNYGLLTSTITLIRL